MECAECGVRSAVGYCNECETLLCEVCGRTCERCGKVACRAHLQRTSSGRNICVTCVVQHYDKRDRQAQGRRERRAEETALGAKVRKHHRQGHRASAAPDQEAPAAESLSFEALSRDLGAAPVPFVPREAVVEERVAPPEERRVPAPAPARADRIHGARRDEYNPLYDQEAINARVLTGSAATRTPPWLSGLALGIVAWGLGLFALRESFFDIQNIILALIAVVVALGTVVWTGPGAFAKAGTPARGKCRAALAIGLGALLFTGWVASRVLS